MNRLEAFLNRYLTGNSVADVLWFAGILLAGFLLKRLVSIVLSRGLFRLVQNRSEHIPVTQFIALLRRPLEFLLLLIVTYLAFDRLSIPAQWNFRSADHFGFRLVVGKLYELLAIIAGAWLMIRLVRFIALIFEKRAGRSESKLDDQLVPFFKDLGIVFVFVTACLVVLGQVFRIDVAALVAGLGIGGLAIALAARETLENLFASFTIFLDHPFVVGDNVQIGTTNGDIEKVGFRSTRIRTADGSLITMPNRLMITQALENQSQRNYRRARYFVKLTLDTPADRLRQIVEDIHQLLTTHERTRDKEPFVWFDSFGDSSLDILVIYFVHTSDWQLFNQVKEEINYRILDAVERHQAALAYPTTTTYLRSQEQAVKGQPFTP
ncbi:MAG: mechanosensitive ion channel family protein [Cytophagaceae bacterium]|nr:mechanosensitive ion channel family protein [Cytophagaceae bacterium]